MLEDFSFLERLFEGNNIAGFWAVIGALIALLGIFINNFFENLRATEKRKLELVRECYFNALNYLALNNYKILKAAAGENLPLREGDIEASANYFQVFMVASPEVIKDITKLSSSYSRILLELSEDLIDLQILSSKLDEANKDIEFNLGVMNDINEKYAKLNENNNTSEELWNMLNQIFSEAKINFESSMGVQKHTNCEILTKKISLLKSGIQALSETSIDLYETILKMRQDLERKLNKKQISSVRSGFEVMLQELKLQIDVFIKKLENKIEELDKREL